MNIGRMVRAGSRSFQVIPPPGIAGAVSSCSSVDGSGLAARFNRPCPLTIDSSGVLYTADLTGGAVRKISTSSAITYFVITN